jgi:hypothetical protein
MVSWFGATRTYRSRGGSAPIGPLYCAVPASPSFKNAMSGG